MGVPAPGAKRTGIPSVPMNALSQKFKRQATILYCVYQTQQSGLAVENLSSYADTDRCKRSVEPDILLLRRIDAAVHRAEEQIGAIARADLGSVVFE